MAEAARQRSRRADGYVNMMSKYGTKQDHGTAWQYQHEGLIPDVELTEHYESDGMFAKIIDAPAEEAVKHGFSLGLQSPDVETHVMDALDFLEFEEKATTAAKYARLYGGALIVMLINDGGGIDEPLDWKRIKGIDELRVYERAVVTPDYSSMYSSGTGDPTRSVTTKFGMPERYQVNSIYGQFWVHESRCLVFRNGILPEHTNYPAYRFWGVPEYVRIRKELRRAVTAHGHGVKMLERAVQGVYSMKGLSELVATEAGEGDAVKRLQLIDTARSLFNSIAIDGDGESYEFKTITLSGAREIIDTTCNMLSAVTNIPQTVLFGRSPAGENSTGRSDLENYYNFVERIQKLMLRGNLKTLINVIARAGLSSGKLDEEPDIKLTFNKLWSLSESEQAGMEQKRAATQLTKAQTAQMYVDMGALDPSEVRKGLARDEEFEVEELLDGMSDEDLMAGWEEPPASGAGLGQAPAAPIPGKGQPGFADAPKAPENSGADGAKILFQRHENPLTQDGAIDRMNDRGQTETDGGPGSGRYPKGTGGDYSATGANPNIPPMTGKNLDKHWGGERDHSKEYPGMSKSVYADRAASLARMPIGGDIDGYKASDGSIVRYDKAANDFVKAYTTGVATMYKPTDGAKYFSRVKKREGGTTDD